MTTALYSSFYYVSFWELFNSTASSHIFLEGYRAVACERDWGTGEFSCLECWTECSGVAWGESPGARPALLLLSGGSNISRGRPSFFMKLFSLRWLTRLSCFPTTVEPPIKLYILWLCWLSSLLEYEELQLGGDIFLVDKVGLRRLQKDKKPESDYNLN